VVLSRTTSESVYRRFSDGYQFKFRSEIPEFVQEVNGPLRLLSVLIVGIGIYRVSADRPAATSEGEGVRFIAERATFRSDARRSAAGANRGRPRDRLEAAPLPRGADPEARAHPPNPEGEGEIFTSRSASSIFQPYRHHNGTVKNNLSNTGSGD